MISYRLKCENHHEFDSWFKSSGDFDRLKALNLVECDLCGSTSVEKSLMAPRTKTNRQNKEPNPLEVYKKNIQKELKGAKNVGWQFAQEARAIHYGDKENTAIYGKTEPEEAIKLLNEGVKIAPLPFDPDAKEN